MAIIGQLASVLTAIDVVGCAEPGDVLDRAGDAERDVEVGVDDHAGRADVPVVPGAHPASVATRRRPTPPPRAAAHLGQQVDLRLVGHRARRPPASDPARLGQIHGRRIGRQ